MKKLEKIVLAHQLKRDGFNVSAIARKCGVSRNTVYTYLGRDFEAAVEWVETLRARKRKLDIYQEVILDWLREHPDLSASQISDWLEERCNFREIGESTVRTYVKELREKYHIPKVLNKRHFEALQELPRGKQMQVDFGELKVKTTDGKTIKIYVIAFVLSHSRYKYVEWQEKPFTTRDVLRCHENAFEFYGGITEEIVYDQDKLMTVSENGGDLIFTEEFQAYKQNRNFRVFLCRKADPESKGKIENVVKFVKYNFGKNRVFHQIETWNEQCLAWLERKGNYQVHNTIKKRPVEVFALEKPHLRKVSLPLSFESNLSYSITRMVHKDNVIKYKSNRYSVPLGTYQPNGENTVYIQVEGEKLFIKASPDGILLATHRLSTNKGKLIKNTHHSRDRSKGIAAYMDTIRTSFHEEEKIQVFLDELHQRYPRYIRDQLQILQKAVKHYKPFIQEALDTCLQKGLWSANDFYDVVKHFSKIQGLQEQVPEDELSGVDVPTELLKQKAALRDIDGYIKILGGV
ncbi:IS21 family transposase [Halobacillus ihumii]|uniref:IS21 family transposase n=1 Tax=Halobacillus ihumii TaxID=2686092 RepID=UPI0013D1B3D0|nr:IS21 family transposase [Halobacillus ihumii]